MIEGCATVPTTSHRNVFKVQPAVFSRATRDLFSMCPSIPLILVI